METDDILYLIVLAVVVAVVPFFQHSPIQDLGANEHLMQLQRDLPLQDAQCFTQSFTGDAAADWIQLGDQLVDFLTSFFRTDFKLE